MRPQHIRICKCKRCRLVFVHDDNEEARALNESVTVNIFNQSYSLRSNHPDSAEHILRLARLVDERMQQIAAQLTVHDVSKVAILAALNLADELSRIKEQQPPEDGASATAAASAQHEAPEEPQTWFDAIFDSSSTSTEKGERLSSRVAAKLKGIRSDESDESDEPTVT